MHKLEAQLKEFHEKFGHLVSDTPEFPSDDVILLRKNLIKEEYEELMERWEVKDIVGVADAIADLCYVLVGTALSFGIPIGDVSDEVHRSNMSKVWEDGSIHKNAYGKVIKPPTYSPANVEGILFPNGESDLYD
jgi:predicted HAD superfamily Cof-like phosphohydrolase